MKRKKKIKMIISFIICLLIILGNSITTTKASSFKINAIKKKDNINQNYAIKKIRHLDRKVSRLTPCDKKNTVEYIVAKYEKNYFMFLADYRLGEEEYTSESLYLVDKKTGAVYTLIVNGKPILLSK